MKFRSPVVLLLHIAAFSGTLTVGVGFTVSVKLCVKPLQLLADGSTVIVAIAGDAPPFVTVNDGMLLPAPVETRPMVLLVFVHV